MAIQNRFYVDLKTTVELDEDHLEISKNAFNYETNPEYFDLYKDGLTYKETLLVESTDIDPILATGMRQKWRVGSNQKYTKIKIY